MPETTAAIGTMIDSYMTSVTSQLDRMESKYDLKLDRIEAQVRSTNGRVTGVEIREAAVKAALDERNRMLVDQQHKDDRRLDDQQKWKGIAPTIIASVSSSIIVALIFLIVTGNI